MTTLTAVLSSITQRDQLGPDATEYDLAAYREALELAWPVDDDEEFDDDEAGRLCEAVQEGRAGRTAEGLDWVQVGRRRAAAAIAEELREVVSSETLEAYIADESEHDSLESYRALVRTRLGGSYDAEAWPDAMELLRAALALVEPVTVAGWYRTRDGRWARVVWGQRGSARAPRVVEVAKHVPTPEEEQARLAREEAEYLDSRR